MTQTSDLVIIGGGPVGATLALALKDAGFSVTVLEARTAGVRSQDQRALALAEGSRQILQRLGVWERLLPSVTPIKTIHISQRGHLGRTVLHAHEAGQPALGYVLPYTALADALDDALAQSGVAKVEYEAQALAVEPHPECATIRYAQQGQTHEVQTHLAVVADGGRSLDLLPEMKREVHEYGQVAVVGKVMAEYPHQGVAYERFTATGPVALLPEGLREFALVWTVSPEQAEELCGLDESEFLRSLHAHFGDRVGAFTQIAGRASFPLKLSTVRPVTGVRTVVIGNAAQTLHPVAGQGFNLGLRDAWELAITMKKFVPGDIGGVSMLEAYRASRRVDTEGGICFTDFLVRTFSNPLPGLGHVRGAGLMALDLMAPVKQFVVRKMGFGANG
jgi:2-octaprenyl-6-methoxyphenol hydroxylase